MNTVQMDNIYAAYAVGVIVTGIMAIVTYFSLFRKKNKKK